MNILDIRGLNVTFNIGGNKLDIISDLDVTIESRKSLSLIGESGSGKSVIAAAVLRALESNAIVSGNVFFKGESLFDISYKRMLDLRGRDICLIPQNAIQAWDPMIRIGKQMKEYAIKCGIGKEVANDTVVDSLTKCGFDYPDIIMSAYPHNISGGMSQRAMIAMCLAVDPELIIADEPTKGLDGKSIRQVLGLMKMIRRSDATLMLITHDLDVAKHCEDIAVLYAGKIAEMGKSNDVIDNPIHPYTAGLIGAQPRNGLNPIPGWGERLLKDGCPYRNRCFKATEKCCENLPFREVSGRLVRCIHV